MYEVQNYQTAPNLVTKAGMLRVREGGVLDHEKSRSARHSITSFKYITQYRPDLSITTRVLSQLMSQPTEGWTSELIGWSGSYRSAPARR